MADAVASVPVAGYLVKAHRPFSRSDDRLLRVNPVWPILQWHKPVTYLHRSLLIVILLQLTGGLWASGAAGLRLGPGAERRGTKILTDLTADPDDSPGSRKNPGFLVYMVRGRQ